MTEENTTETPPPLTGREVAPMVERLQSWNKGKSTIRHSLMTANLLLGIYNHAEAQHNNEADGYAAVAMFINAIDSGTPFDDKLNESIMDIRNQFNENNSVASEMLRKDSSIRSKSRRAVLKKGLQFAGAGAVFGAGFLGTKLGYKDLFEPEAEPSPDWKDYAGYMAGGGALFGAVIGIRVAYKEHQNRKDFSDFPVDKTLEIIERELQIRVHELNKNQEASIER